uniref:Putative secreted peptide n=1 Tax=Anopheles braziliensis TaxID=58242 RepID=A0A2M3ZXP7_9DIPT
MPALSGQMCHPPHLSAAIMMIMLPSCSGRTFCGNSLLAATHVTPSVRMESEHSEAGNGQSNISQRNAKGSHVGGAAGVFLLVRFLEENLLHFSQRWESVFRPRREGKSCEAKQ